MKLELNAAASPARVAVVASMLADALEATGLLESDASMTLVVENFELGATLRPRDSGGRHAVDILRDVLVNPVLAVQKHSEARVVAKKLAIGGRKLLPATARVLVEDKEVAQLDDVLVRALQAVSEPPAVDVPMVRGSGVVASTVLRVGRAAERGGCTAKIKIDNEWVDVRVDPQHLGDFFDVAKLGTKHKIRVHGEWRSDTKNGALTLDPRSVVALSILGPCLATSGADFLEAADNDESAHGILSGSVSSILEELGLDS